MIAWFLCGALLTGCAGMLRSVAYGPDNATALDRVRLHLFCERNDLTLSPISDVREPFFTGTTQRLLDRPLALKPLRRQVSSVLLRKNAGFAAAAEVAGMLLELDTAELARAEVPAGELPAGLPEELSGLYAAMAQAWDRYRRAFERLSADEALFVKQQLELCLFSNDSSEGTRWERQSNRERAFGIAARIDLQQIAAALYLIVASLEMDLQDLRDVAGNSDEVLSI
ncbi:MAG: hypothetical protein GY868_19540, partial [Deltaproteobacteria bacterium]|nr:hypothetical protein [Deltaproteobacteria bacterium]